MRLKKIAAFVVFSVMVLVASGCSKDNEQPETGTQESVGETVSAESGQPSSIELAGLMGNGINLGNTMEAYGHFALGTDADVEAYETFWGQPRTTREMILAMKESGFDTLRIPVAWTNTMNFESGDYSIREDYLARVGEIIQYALDADMYVIINDHWDGSWWGMFGSADEKVREKAMDMYSSMWTNIAEYYKDMPSKLIFESANEELGSRLNDTDIAKDSGSLDEDGCYEMTNKINQQFVDVVRSTGGNNADRYLLIAGYNTDIVKTTDDRYRMPADTADDKLLVSVHYYTPFSYCGTSEQLTWGTYKQYKEQNELLQMMTKFTDRGYGVVIGEYAVAFREDGKVKENTCDFFNNFLDNCDMYGYCPVLWDCSGLFVRSGLKWSDSEVEKLFASRSGLAQKGIDESDIKQSAKDRISEALENALAKEPVYSYDEAAANAWIMYASSDWGVTYSVGDKYSPAERTDGLRTVDAVMTGEGTYTISLDFTGTPFGKAKGISFCAIGISNGEELFADYCIEIKDIIINGKSADMIAKGYTTSDDGLCTRQNIYNEWVSGLPKGARSPDGDLSSASACLIDNKSIGDIYTLEIVFEYR